MESDFCVTSTWESDRAAYQDILTFGDALDPQQKSHIGGEIIHVINEDTFVYLKRPAEDVPCILSFDFKESSYKITNISVVSEGRVVEVYGRHGEYLATSHGLLLDKQGGRSFFNSQLQLSSLSGHHLSIKFLGLKEDEEGLWVFGIKLVRSRGGSSPGPSVFDFSVIESKLASSQLPITTRADKLKQFLQNYTSNKWSGKMDPYTLMRMVEEECRTNLRPIGDVGKHMITSLMQNILLKGNRTEEEVKKESQEEAEGGKDTERHVEEGLKQLERRLKENFQRLEVLECSQNQKLEELVRRQNQGHENNLQERVGELESTQELGESEDRQNLNLRENFQRRLEMLECRRNQGQEKSLQRRLEELESRQELRESEDRQNLNLRENFQRRLEELEKSFQRRLEELEGRQNQKLEELEARQSEKLDMIVSLLKGSS